MNAEPVTLKDYTYSIVAGVSTPTLSRSTSVFAVPKSVTYAEFYQATANGFKADIVFDMYSFEYSGEETVEYAGEEYEVLRTYQKTKDRIELTCRKKVEK